MSEMYADDYQTLSRAEADAQAAWITENNIDGGVKRVYDLTNPDNKKGKAQWMAETEHQPAISLWAVRERRKPPTTDEVAVQQCKDEWEPKEE
jgi:hypothetical protein